MKAKKWITFITFGISMGSLICAIITTCGEKCELFYDISMAIFGSALLGFIMSLIEYFVERRKAMEYFLTAAYKIYVQLRKIKYLDIDIPQEILVDCILEEQNNDFCYKLGEENAKILGLEVNHKKRDAYLSWIEENEVTSFSEKDDIEAILVEIYNQRIDKYKKVFISLIDIYIEISKINYEELSNAFGGLDFLFGNKKLRKTAYDSIYVRLQNYRNKILAEVFHFDLLKDGKGNFAICVKKLFELNNYFFEQKTNKASNGESIIVYQHLFDELADRMEDFRASTYFKKVSEYPKRIPVFSKFNNIEMSKDESAF